MENDNIHGISEEILITDYHIWTQVFKLILHYSNLQAKHFLKLGIFWVLFIELTHAQHLYSLFTIKKHTLRIHSIFSILPAQTLHTVSHFTLHNRRILFSIWCLVVAIELSNSIPDWKWNISHSRHVCMCARSLKREICESCTFWQNFVVGCDMTHT